VSGVWAQFTGIPNGTRIANYGFDQCVALANHYHAMLGGQFVPVQSAFQWWTNRYPQVDAIYDRSATPVPGALFVSRGGIYNQPDGHIGVVTAVHPDGTFDTMEQKAGTWRYLGRYRRSMANMLGFLIPKNNPATTAPPAPPTGGQPMFDVYWTGPNASNTQVSGRLITAYGSYWIPSIQVYNLLLRRKNAALKPGASDNMLDAEHDIINNYLRACFQSATTGIQLDPAKLRAALPDALKAAGTSIKVEASTEVPVDKLAAAFEAATPRIVAALMKQAGQRLAS